MKTLDPARRRQLRAALRRHHPWVDDRDVGPRAVEAGECDRCGQEARLITTCGPTRWEAIGRRCATEIGVRAWCDGHAEDGARWLTRLADLPAEADTVARLWWVATGEVRMTPAGAAPLVSRALPPGTIPRG